MTSFAADRPYPLINKRQSSKESSTCLFLLLYIPIQFNKMSFQISIGDVMMLSKLAWSIARAFTSGRKSAPAEFQEVQNQLSSLCHALDSLKSLSLQCSGQAYEGSGSSIMPILQNCRFTLEHLDSLVSKYTAIDSRRGADGSEKRHWREDIWKNWKKVRWTREGGDLSKLQHNLGVHINSLNLTIAVLNRYDMPICLCVVTD